MDTNQSLLGSRIQKLSSGKSSQGTCVLYVMSRDQRVRDNYALLAAQSKARSLELPLVVGFILYPASRTRSKEHVAFMIEGLEQLAADLAQRNIPLICKKDAAQRGAQQLLDQLEPAAVYCDFSPLRSPRKRAQILADVASCPVFVVDTHNVVPLWVTSRKQEYAARTIRPKIHSHLATYLDDPTPEITQQAQTDIKGATPEDIRKIGREVDYRSSGIVHGFQSGEKAAHKQLTEFIDSRLPGYAEQRNDPGANSLSNLSPYLHFGQLSSRQAVRSAQAALAADSSLQQDVDAFIEEVVVRKELSDNFCYYATSYTSLRGAPDWAQKTLKKHQDDPRELVYSREQFEQAKTHDPAWNAAQIELTKTGKMHGYMRMYWAKKILEWSPNPESALETLIWLNDFYSLDGGDPNGYTGIMWSVAGVHDRPWQERPVYGTIRSMVYSGLKRKFDIQHYIDKYVK